MFVDSTADLHRALRRRVWTRVKYQRHPVTGRNPSQFARAFRRPETFGAPHDSIQFLQQLNLLINQQL
jgi:hypothetical protein